jgi:hypothetical protein
MLSFQRASNHKILINSRAPALTAGNSIDAYTSFYLHCSRAYRTPDHSIRIAEYHQMLLLLLLSSLSSSSLNPTSSLRLEPTMFFGFVTLVPVIFLPKKGCALRHSSVVFSF